MVVNNSLIECSSSTEVCQPAVDKHLEALKVLMTPAETQSRQSQPHFLDAVCQSGSWPEQTGGPVRVIGKKRGLETERKKTEQRKEKFGV